jgi:hypothetical protein
MKTCGDLLRRIRETSTIELAVVVFFLASLAVTCSCSFFDNTTDCNAVCERYAGCFDDGYDSDRCTKRCIDNSWGNDDYTAQVNACDACIATQDCLTNAFECGSDCADIIDE